MSSFNDGIFFSFLSFRLKFFYDIGVKWQLLTNWLRFHVVVEFQKYLMTKWRQTAWECKLHEIITISFGDIFDGGLKLCFALICIALIKLQVCNASLLFHRVSCKWNSIKVLGTSQKLYWHRFTCWNSNIFREFS